METWLGMVDFCKAKTAASQDRVGSCKCLVISMCVIRVHGVDPDPILFNINALGDKGIQLALSTS